MLAPPLWQQLDGAARLLAAVGAGQSASKALLQCDPALRPGVQALGYTALRHWGRTRALTRLLVQRVAPEHVQALLCTALAVFLDASAGYQPYALVDQAVEAAKRLPSGGAHAGLVNACLRRFLRQQDMLLRQTGEDLIARWNHPAWWVKRVQNDYPAQWQRLLQANQSSAPMTLRVNRRKSSVPLYLGSLDAIKIGASKVLSDGLILHQALPVERLPGFELGWFSVQDAAAQRAAPLLLQALSNSSGARVLDACAAPGGKAAHLAESADIDLVALDHDSERVARIYENFKRLGLSAQVLVGDACQPSAWWDGKAFDAILLDAPCSASGVVRRHPDVRWLRRASDVAAFSSLQRQMLNSLWPLLAPGGVLLYCTCSVFKAEGDEIAKAFLAHNTQAILLPSPGHLLTTEEKNATAVLDNQGADHDGFYYALLQKRR